MSRKVYERMYTCSAITIFDENMGQEFTEARVKHTCDWLMRNHPEQHCDFYKFWIAVEILRVLVDNEWTNQTIFPDIHPNTSSSVQSAVTYLRADTRGFQFQERVSKLAIRLYDSQYIPGLNRVTKSLIKGDIALAYAELEASSFFVRRSIEHEFVTACGEKGKDYDIRLIAYGVNCEVKHKIESTVPSKEALEKTLSVAKSQVPSNEPALFFVKIPIAWVQHPGMASIVDRTKRTFFPRSPHVMGIILHWEELQIERAGMFFWKFRYELNDTCTLANKELSEVILKQDVGARDSIVELMNRYISKCSNYPASDSDESTRLN